jgi:ankyrin repeat protein
MKNRAAPGVVNRESRWSRVSSVLALALWSLLTVGGATAQSSSDSGVKSPLQEAILAGDEERARVLIAEGESASEALIAAARTGNLSLLELLVDAGADVEGFFGARALVVSMLVEDDEAAGLLEARGAHLEARDEAGRTVLVWASGQRRLGPLVRTAIDAGADLEASSRTGETALMTASRFARVGSVRTLLRAGATVDARDRDGWTPLMFAVRSQSAKIVGLLLDAGADPEAESTLGWTPLMLASWEGKVRIVNGLLRAGADPDHRTSFEPAPLVRAVQGGHGAVARRLVAEGADIGDGSAGDPTWWTQKLGRQRLRKLLVAAGGAEG